MVVAEMWATHRDRQEPDQWAVVEVATLEAPNPFAAVVPKANSSMPPPVPRKAPPPAPPPARPKAMPVAAATGLAEAQADRDWDRRLAAAQEHGAEVAAALDCHWPVPAAPPLPPPLRSRVWVVIGGMTVADVVGIYGCAEHAHSSRTGVVRGYPSLAEACAFGRGAGVDELPDRRF